MGAVGVVSQTDLAAKGKKKKDPQAPKSRKKAFQFFKEDHRTRVKEALGQAADGAATTDRSAQSLSVNAQLQRQWDSLTAEQKKVYEVMSLIISTQPLTSVLFLRIKKSLTDKDSICNTHNTRHLKAS